MIKIKRLFCLCLAVFMLVFTPVSDYFGARYAYGSGALSAVEYVWTILMAARGVDVAKNDLNSVISDIGNFVKLDTKYLAAYKAMGDLAYGSVVKLGQEAIDMVTDYFKTKSGYGTNTGISKLQIGLDNSYENSYSYNMGIDLAKFNPALSSDDYYFSYDHSSDNPIRHSDIFLLQKDKRVGGVLSSSKTLEIFYMNDDNKLVSPVSRVTYSNNSGTNTYYPNEKNNFSYMLISGTDYTAETMVNIPFPVYGSLDQLKTYLSYGTLGETVNEYTGSYTWVDVNSDVDTQQRDITSDVEVTIPKDSYVAEQLVSDVQSSITAADRAQVLAPTINVTYGEKAEEGENTGTYPWIPDITKPLGVITDVVKGIARGVTDVKNRILDIPAALSGILDGVKALPVSITDSIAKALAGEEDAKANNWQIQSDITRKFPFCIPFDLFACISVFESTSTVPRWELPFAIESLNIRETIVIDLSTDDWKPMVMLIRVTTLIGYCICLIVITRGLVKG
jgi:hypothetical protein